MKKLFLLLVLSLPLFGQWVPARSSMFNVGSSNSIYYNSGFFGLGTSSPTYLLTGVTTSANLINMTGWGSSIFRVSSGSSNITLGQDASSKGLLLIAGGTTTNGIILGSNGNVGINTGTAAGANKVRVVGGMYADTVLYTTLVNLSDITKKWSVEPVKWNLSHFNEVTPIYYKYKKEVFSDLPDSIAEELSQLQHTGFSAQEFNAKIVGTDSKQIDLMQINVALWLKVQELEARIKQLESK